MGTEHTEVITLLATIVKSTEKMEGHLKELNGKVYTHEKDKADRLELESQRKQLTEHIKNVEKNSNIKNRNVCDDLDSIEKKVDANTSKIWKMSLLLAGGITGGLGVSELIKYLIGG